MTRRICALAAFFYCRWLQNVTALSQQEAWCLFPKNPFSLFGFLVSIYGQLVVHSRSSLAKEFPCTFIFQEKKGNTYFMTQGITTTVAQTLFSLKPEFIGMWKSQQSLPKALFFLLEFSRFLAFLSTQNETVRSIALQNPRKWDVFRNFWTWSLLIWVGPFSVYLRDAYSLGSISCTGLAGPFCRHGTSGTKL